MLRELTDAKAYVLVEVEETLRRFTTPADLQIVMDWLVGNMSAEENALKVVRKIRDNMPEASTTILEAMEFTRTKMYAGRKENDADEKKGADQEDSEDSEKIADQLDFRWMSNYDFRKHLVRCFGVIARNMRAGRRSPSQRSYN